MTLPILCNTSVAKINQKYEKHLARAWAIIIQLGFCCFCFSSTVVEVWGRGDSSTIEATKETGSRVELPGSESLEQFQ